MTSRCSTVARWASWMCGSWWSILRGRERRNIWRTPGGAAITLPPPGGRARPRAAEARRRPRHRRAGRHHLAIGRNIHAHQIFIEPADDVLQPLDAMPRLAGARKLVRFAGEAHHDDRFVQELQRPEHLLAAAGGWRAIV